MAGFAYFGTGTDPGIVAKVALEPPAFRVYMPIASLGALRLGTSNTAEHRVRPDAHLGDGLKR
jgi:hypothetical protein